MLSGRATIGFLRVVTVADVMRLLQGFQRNEKVIKVVCEAMGINPSPF
jgi:hypothetical protein